MDIGKLAVELIAEIESQKSHVEGMIVGVKLLLSKIREAHEQQDHKSAGIPKAD